jgi:hypothetical protein
MHQFKSFHRISIITPEGVVAVGQNVPEVTYDGKLHQGTALEMLRWATSNLECGVNVIDVKMEEFPLDGDFKLRTPTDFLTDEGLAYVLASILNWKSPLNGAEIIYKYGEGIYVNNPVEILNLNDAFKTFDPVNDLALCMAILQKFKIEIRYDSKSGAARIRPRPDMGVIIDDTEIRREICRRAIEECIVIPGSGWDGTVHLSMVTLPPEPPKTIAEMAPGQQEVVDAAPDMRPSDVFSAARVALATSDQTTPHLDGSPNGWKDLGMKE